MTLDAFTAIPQVRHSIDKAVRDHWVISLGQDDSRISWPNAQFETPNHRPWLRVSHNFGTAEPKTMVGPECGLSLMTAMLVLTVLGPKAEGTVLLDGYASSLAARFSRRAIGQAEFQQFDGPRSVGNPTWASAQVTVVYQFYLSFSPLI